MPAAQSVRSMNATRSPRSAASRGPRPVDPTTDDEEVEWASCEGGRVASHHLLQSGSQPVGSKPGVAWSVWRSQPGRFVITPSTPASSARVTARRPSQV